MWKKDSVFTEMNDFRLSENPHRGDITQPFTTDHCFTMWATPGLQLHFGRALKLEVDMLKVIRINNSELSNEHSNNELLLITFSRQFFQRPSKRFCETLRCHSSSSQQLKPPKDLSVEDAFLILAEVNIQLYICFI